MIDLDHLWLERRVDALLAPWSHNEGAGVTIGVVLDGALCVHRHAGLASIEHGVPISDETRFRIASVSKQFTCAAILMLEAENSLSLDEPARTYVPELPDSVGRVTVAQLMHNSSGLRDMFEILRHGGADLGTPVQPGALLDGIIRQQTLNFESGSRFLYSNSNFLLLGLIVERLSGRSLDAFLQERIFAPLGMTDTRVTPDTAEAIPHLATGYLRGGDAVWRRAPHAFPLGGEGGLVSSVRDLALWARNFSTRRVGAEWLSGLLTQTPFSNGTENRYARGLVIRPYRGMATWSHGGLWPGFRTEFLMVPDQQATVIVIANQGGADPNLLAHRVLDAVLDGRPGVHPAPPGLPRDVLSRLLGRYLDDATETTLDIDVGENGETTLTTYGIPAIAEATEDGRLAIPRSSSNFALRPLAGDRVEIEQDAGTIGVWRRIEGGSRLPEGLAGRYRSEEMATEWTVTEQDGKTSIVASGPVATGPAWDVEPIKGDVFRVRTPGTLYRGWLDVRASREGGRIDGLIVSGGRVKRVRYDRLT